MAVGRYQRKEDNPPWRRSLQTPMGTLRESREMRTPNATEILFCVIQGRYVSNVHCHLSLTVLPMIKCYTWVWKAYSSRYGLMTWRPFVRTSKSYSEVRSIDIAHEKRTRFYGTALLNRVASNRRYRLSLSSFTKYNFLLLSLCKSSIQLGRDCLGAFNIATLCPRSERLKLYLLLYIRVLHRNQCIV